MKHLSFLMLSLLFGLPVMTFAQGCPEERSIREERGQTSSASVPQTVEGVLQKIENGVYWVVDDTGKEVRLSTDGHTDLDGNVTPGDRVLAKVPVMTSVACARSLNKRSKKEFPPQSYLEGQVLRIDGDTYWVRDVTGKDVHLYLGKEAQFQGTLAIGDTVHASLDAMTSTGYAAFLHKR